MYHFNYLDTCARCCSMGAACFLQITTLFVRKGKRTPHLTSETFVCTVFIFRLRWRTSLEHALPHSSSQVPQKVRNDSFAQTLEEERIPSTIPGTTLWHSHWKTVCLSPGQISVFIPCWWVSLKPFLGSMCKVCDSRQHGLSRSSRVCWSSKSTQKHCTWTSSKIFIL